MKFAFFSLAACASACESSIMPGLECNTDDSAVLGHSQASTQEECCDACSRREGCGAWVFRSDTSMCTLKAYCKQIAVPFLYDPANVVSGAVPVPKPAPFCPVTYTSQGYRCQGGTIKTVSAKNVADCCKQCGELEECSMFSLSNSGSCELKSSCPEKVPEDGWDTAWRAQAEPKSWDYNVGLATITIPGYQCGNKDGTTLVFYPEAKSANEKFHVVVYAHGMGGYLDDGSDPSEGKDNGLDSWLQDVASAGLIVLAPFTGPGLPPAGMGCGAEYKDMMLALSYAREHPSLHPALASADFSRLGAFGHSMGGSAAPRIAEFGPKSGLNIVAAVASHGAASVTHVGVPMLFTTGTLDTRDVDKSGNPGHFKHEFELCKSPTKVFVNLKGGYHMEPCEGKRLNYVTVQFLSCHVNENQDHCNYIYGEQGLCSRGDLAECKVVQHKGISV